MQFNQRAQNWMKNMKYSEQNLDSNEQLYNSFIQQFIDLKTEQIIFEKIENLENQFNYGNNNDSYEQMKNNIIVQYYDINEYHKNEELYSVIEKDAPQHNIIYRRTMPDVPFFQEQCEQQIPFRFYTSIYRHRKQQNMMTTRNYDILGRILYIYGKLNPGIKYVQGMNELLAPFYYVFQNEAHSFFCFTILMSYHRDLFIRDLDLMPQGIRGKLLLLEQQFKKNMPKLFKHFSSIGIHPQMYGYRWFVACMTQEFTFEQILILWDMMLQVNDYHQFQMKIALAVLKYLETQLLKADLNEAIILLLKSDKDIQKILEIYQKL